MSSRRMALVPLVVACAISVAYIFVFGIDWGFTFRSSTVPSAIFTGLLLSAWASVPYFILLPMAQREGRSLFTILAVLVILVFGMFSMNLGRHTPGDEGGSYIVVPFQQMEIAAVIIFGWWLIRRLAR
jgi:hypothetical protein